ncbi:MAG TPA: SAM-dependent methyltransferase [Nocardioides bacterium]|uniref:SAM-dependent methyltransferase n=1 Tax=uncultured Nocardioides sp. TaxID=198441 RepID=UPI000EEE1A9B|nr:cyclopropane-fatty-acyl-phospholipid synthase family protein [uncultured Nocardioides sp.]HCB04887.1 SAM-dependent methyltransferase [Nocardioides sp.]HRD61974.1 cyclopropane-fatty-acyl-phospholipid synthase family protein [Nocardioides sp.]
MTELSDRKVNLRARHWPGLEQPPTGPRARVSARIARGLFRAAVERLAVTVQVGDETWGRGGPVAVVHRPEELFARLGRDQLIGFGEAYLTGAWDAEDLAGFLTVLAAELPRLVPARLQRLRGLVVRKPPADEVSSTANSQQNIAHHYDLSNELFELFLDPTLSYSSGLFDGPLGSQEALEVAQGRKIERLLDQARVGEGTRLLEIGTGWGELALRAARRGASVTTITLSVEQRSLAKRRIAEAGLADSVTVELCDYRDAPPPAGGGGYDAVVSVEMIEAVGWQFWRTYFETLDRLLAPGGTVAIQAITMSHDRMLATRRTYTWINKYIFPGGFLPSVRVIDEITREHTRLRMAPPFSMGPSYARTLQLWDEAFLAASDQVRALGFDETFLRMWHFYLEYSRAGFASGYLDVHQLTFTRDT